MTTVVLSEESPRGCGYRKPDKTGVGIYLTAPGPGYPCARLPLPLHVCPVCSEGGEAVSELDVDRAPKALRDGAGVLARGDEDVRR